MKERTSNFQGFGSWLAVSFVLVFCCSQALADVRPFNNLNQSTAGTCGTEFGLGCAQRFQTADQDGHLNSVSLSIYELSVQGPDAQELTYGTPIVSLYSDGISTDTNFPGNVPLALLATLTLDPHATIPQGSLNGAVRFNADFNLAENTAYWVVLTGTGDTEWAYTNCTPGGDGTAGCPSAYTPGDPASALSFGNDSWYPASFGTQLMAVNEFAVSGDGIPVPEAASVAQLFVCLTGLIACRARR